MKRWTISMAALLGVFLLVACGEGEKGTGQSAAKESTELQRNDLSGVIARVGDTEITQEYFDDRYKALSPSLQARFSGDNWRQRFLKEVIDEILLSKEAEKEKFDRDPRVQKQLLVARREILVKAYTNWIKNHAQPTEEEIQEYWEKNKESYRGLSRALVSHIQCKDEKKIKEAYAKLEAGESFEKVAAQFDEDPNTRSKKGMIGWINPGGYVLGVGYDKTFTETAFNLGSTKYSKPLFIKGNWHIIFRGDKVEGKIPDLDKIRDRVVEDLRPLAISDFYGQKMKEIAKEFPVERYGQYRLVDADSADQLYKRAADAKNPYARIDYYQEIVDHFPDSEYADDSLFMIGFLYNEALGRPGDAVHAFRKLIASYPKSEFIDDAEWMLKNSGKMDQQKVGAKDAQDLQNKVKEFRAGE